MLEAFVISIAANLATSAGARVLSQFVDNSIYRKIEAAFSDALKKWCKNEDIANRESIWTHKRLDELALLMSDPSKESQIDTGTLRLLSLFKLELQKDDATWHYLEGEFYKNLMTNLLDIKSIAQIIQDDVQARKIDSIDLKNKLIEQTDFQVNKNIISRKYIPDTFMEVSELKDRIRYFSDPFLFYNRVYDKISQFNFEYLNRKLVQDGEQLFHFDINSYQIDRGIDFESLYKVSGNLLKYLNTKYDELYSGGNRRLTNSLKVERQAKDVEFINRRLCIFTAHAGQGKTNLICDFAKNVLIKRNIPSLYINGYEIDASSIQSSLAHAIYPTNSYSFAEILTTIRSYCTETKKPFIIILDGLNENSNSRLLCDNLCILIRELLNYKFIKIILTCRTEYYKERFSDIGNNFREQTIMVDHFHAHLSDAQKERLINNYLEFFKIQASLSDEVSDELTENLLLLRIFAEAYQNQTLSFVSDLHKDELFNLYYQKTIDSITCKLSLNGYASLNSHLIKKFIGQIIAYMVEYQKFTNISILDIIDLSQIDLYNRFLDENILLRRDLISSPGVFGTIEVINFTYDEFRDYLIACHLVGNVYPVAYDKFESFITVYTQKEQQLAEGLRSFLFLITKKNPDKKIHLWLKSFDWYKSVFANHIWDVNDEYIDSEDILLVEKLLVKYNLVPNLLFKGRWDSSRFKKININILLKFVASLSDSDLQEKIYSIWRSDTKYWYGVDDKNWKHFLAIHNELLSDHTFFQNPDSHNIFEFFLYLTPFSYDALEIYEMYLKQYGNKEQLLKVKENCQSDQLKRTIDSILKKL